MASRHSLVSKRRAAVATGILLGVAHDLIQRVEPTLRVAPIVARVPPLLRSFREMLRVPSAKELPFTDDVLVRIRKSAKSGNDITSFGTRKLHESDRETPVSLFPARDVQLTGNLVGSGSAAIEFPVLNFGALGFGPVNDNVLGSIAWAANATGALMNSGEDGLVQVHRDSAQHVIWQLGTGYWGCRTDDGRFSLESFSQTLAELPLAAVELKLGQGAKPGAGGLMPASKNTPRVARMLGVPAGTDIKSPRAHPEFDSVPSLAAFLNTLKTHAGGRPVGIKMCLGSGSELSSLLKYFAEEGTVIDYICIDDSAGGTGAGPTSLQEHAGTGIEIAVPHVGRLLEEVGLRDQIRVFAAGRVHDGYSLLRLLSLGADGVFFTRAPLVAMGCVQARRCHIGDCPAGIATQSAWRRRAITPDVQGAQVESFYRSVLGDAESLIAASGHTSLQGFLADWRSVPDIV